MNSNTSVHYNRDETEISKNKSLLGFSIKNKSISVNMTRECLFQLYSLHNVNNLQRLADCKEKFFTGYLLYDSLELLLATLMYAKSVN
jgi:hypothetical protein